MPANLIEVAYSLMTPGRSAAMPRLGLFVPPEKGSSIRKGPASGTLTLDQQGQTDQQDPYDQQSPAGQQGQQQGQADHQGPAAAKDKGFNRLLGIEESPHPERKACSVGGTAVFSGDKLAGWLNEQESLGAMLITGQAKGGSIPFAFRSPEKNASYIFRVAKTSVKPVISRDGITFVVNIKGMGALMENKNAAIEATKKSDLQAAEQLIDEEAQRRCQEAVARCQELNSDIFGFGEMIHVADPTFWKQFSDRWPDYFPGVKVQVTAKFTIKNTGVTGDAIKPGPSRLMHEEGGSDRSLGASRIGSKLLMIIRSARQLL
jgi:spore germination protein KC